MEELVARSSLVIALYGRSGVSNCGHGDYGNIPAALEQHEGELAGRLLLTHIDHVEADLHLRKTGKLPLREALAIRKQRFNTGPPQSWLPKPARPSSREIFAAQGA